MAQFFQSFAVECCAEKDWKVLQKQLTTETIKEKLHLDGFLESVCASTVEAKRKKSTFVLTDGFPAMRVEDLDSCAAESSSSLPEEDMRRITKQLEEYTALKCKRKATVLSLEQSRCRRSRAVPFAQRLRAIVAAEDKFQAVDASVPLSLLVVVDSLRECTELATNEAFYSEFEKRQERIDAADDEDAREPSHEAESKASLTVLVEQATEFVTMRYIEKRLGGIPARLHLPFVFLVAVAVGEAANGGEFETAAYTDLLQSSGLPGAAPSSCYYCNAGSSEAAGADSSAKIVSQLAHHVVSIVTEVATISVTYKLLDPTGDSDLVHLLAALSCLDAGMRLAFVKIRSKFARASSGARKRVFGTDLLDDMRTHAESWRAYLTCPFGTSQESSKTISSLLSTRSLSAKPNYPPWIATQLTPLERLSLHHCLFGSLPTAVLHEFVAVQLGEKLLANLSARLDSSLKRSLVTVAKSGVFSTPILLVSDPSRQVAAPLSDLLQSAKTLGVHADALSCVSMGSDVSVPGFRLSEFSHNNLIANAHALNYADAIKRLGGIKESSLRGGWMAVKDIRHGSLAAKNALRLQVETMTRLHANKSNNFRLWLQFDVLRRDAARSRCGALSSFMFGAGDDDFFALLPGDRMFVESPQTLAHRYAVHAGDEEKKTSEKTQKPQQQVPPPHRPKLLRRQGSFSIAPTLAATPAVSIDARAAEQWWVEAAMWVFHAVFRQHLRLSDAYTAHDERRASVLECLPDSQRPADLVVSQLELERSLRLIQLHIHQKVLASRATPAGLGSSASASASSSALKTPNASAETHVIVELATLMYMGRQSSDVRSRQCRELLEWCLTAKKTPRHLNGAGESASSTHEAPSAQLRNQFVHLREDILGKTLDTGVSFAGSSSSSRIERTCLPLQLQHESESREASELLRVLRRSSAVRSDVRVTRHGRSTLTAAQHALRRVRDRLPDRTSLSGGVEQQRIQRRTSVFAAYRRGTKVGVVAQQAAAVQMDEPAESSSGSSRSWQSALLSHLVEVELPAMEAYLQYVWSVSDTISSLRPSSHDAAMVTSTSSALYQEIATTLDALGSGLTPAPWRSFTSTQTSTLPSKPRAGYSTPALLDDWLDWLGQAAAFYRRVQLQPTRLVDVVWVPGLQHPKGAFRVLLRERERKRE